MEWEKCLAQRQRVAKRTKVLHAEQQHGGVCLACLWHHEIKGFTKNREKCPSVSCCARLGKMRAIIVARHNLDSHIRATHPSVACSVGFLTYLSYTHTQRLTFFS